MFCFIICTVHILQGRQAIILGRGIEQAAGEWQLASGSMERAQRAILEYQEYYRAYSTGVIVCSGGYPRLAEERPPKSEAKLMADELIKGGVRITSLKSKKNRPARSAIS
jgi:hypothetical protein